jgi:hypothetical protein
VPAARRSLHQLPPAGSLLQWSGRPARARTNSAAASRLGAENERHAAMSGSNLWPRELDGPRTGGFWCWTKAHQVLLPACWVGPR